jgi:hypothetical protein
MVIPTASEDDRLSLRAVYLEVVGAGWRPFPTAIRVGRVRLRDGRPGRLRLSGAP